MLPSKPGTYIASVKSVGIEQKDSGAVQASIALDLDYLMGATPDENIEDASGQAITAYLFLTGKNDTGNKINEINVRSLRDALGWDGTSFASLQEGDWTDVKVQAVIENDTYNGKTSLKVRYVNPRDYAGGAGMKKADDASLKVLDAKFGGMLRAINGAKPGAKPASRSPAATKAQPGAASSIGKEMAWKTFTGMVDVFNKANPGDAYTESKRVETFRSVVSTAAKDYLATPKKTAELNDKDWAEVNSVIAEKFSAATGDIIPF